MDREIKLQVSESFFQQLSERAMRQGASLDAFCLSLLSVEEDLLDPKLYRTLSKEDMKIEKAKIMRSKLPTQDINKRLRNLSQANLDFIRK